jgi:hypothetical protein
MDTTFINEDFSGTFPPSGWSTDYWYQSNTNYAGGTSPEAQLHKYTQMQHDDYYHNYIQSPPIDTSSKNYLTLTFKASLDVKYAGYYDWKVLTRADSSDTWTDRTPWTNPIPQDYPGQTWEVHLDDDVGTGTQIMWEGISYYYYFDYFRLDDVVLQGVLGDPPAQPTQDALEIDEVEFIFIASTDVPYKTNPYPKYKIAFWEDYGGKPKGTSLDDAIAVYDVKAKGELFSEDNGYNWWVCTVKLPGRMTLRTHVRYWISIIAIDFAGFWACERPGDNYELRPHYISESYSGNEWEALSSQQDMCFKLNGRVDPIK